MNRARSATHPSRRLLVTGLAVLALLAVNFWWTGQWLVARWEQANSYYSHGWLVPPICAGLLYLRRRQLAAASVRPCRWGLALLVPAILLHLLGTAWQVGFMSGFALLGVLAGLVLTTLGPDVLRVALFPMAFLVFMVPVPEVLIEKVSFNLKSLAAAVSASVLDIMGFAAVRQGSYIQIPSGSVIVDDVCSGLKYLIALTAFGALYAYISRLRPALKVVLFALAIPVAFVANVVRVTLMVLVAYVWGLGVSERWYVHDLFGFALFAVAFVLLFVAESVLLGLTRRESGEDGPEPEQDGEGSGEGTASGGGLLAAGLRSAPMKGVFCLLAASAAVSLYLAWPRETMPATERLAAFPRELGEWRGVDMQLSEREYEVLGTANVLSRLYENPDGHQVQLMVVVAQQIRRRTHPPEQCLTGGGNSITGTSRRPVTFSIRGAERTIEVQELTTRNTSLGTKIAWYFFKSGDQVHTSYWRHQAGVALRKLRDPDAADVLVRFDAAARTRGRDEARAVLSDFARDALPAVMAYLP